MDGNKGKGRKQAGAVKFSGRKSAQEVDEAPVIKYFPWWPGTGEDLHDYYVAYARLEAALDEKEPVEELG